ncbi:helix-hairpin-helix domain-containing protein [Jannaschia sp. R86511]|uniref:helix-hairpin-helix domain-containing protein n=1 Tax=Jannaschia sp. R86511 TaxID=3093853 RepID=UPI0036D41156
MGRGAGDDAERLLRRLRGLPVTPTGGWTDGDRDGDQPDPRRPDLHGADPDPDPDPDPFPVPPADGGRRRGAGRHAGRDEARAPGWRLVGVPPGLAVLLLVGAVVAVVVLGRGGGGEELVVGPAGAEAVASSGATDPDLGGEDPGGAELGGADLGGAGLAGAAEEGAGGGPGDGAAADGAPVGGDPADGAPEGGDPADGAAPVPSVPAAPQEIVVHVDGAVLRPGLVRLPAGARVADAVTAAGGAGEDADTRLVNLARPLADGELVVVPRPGEQVPAPPGPPAAGGPGDGAAGGPAAGSQDAGGTAPGALVDLNRADVAALDALPGIGPALAGRIVAFREEQGPFVSVDDVTSVSGIGPAVLADIRDLVTV